MIACKTHKTKVITMAKRTELIEVSVPLIYSTGSITRVNFKAAKISKTFCLLSVNQDLGGGYADFSAFMGTFSLTHISTGMGIGEIRGKKNELYEMARKIEELFPDLGDQSISEADMRARAGDIGNIISKYRT